MILGSNLLNSFLYNICLDRQLSAAEAMLIQGIVLICPYNQDINEYQPDLLLLHSTVYTTTKLFKHYI